MGKCEYGWIIRWYRELLLVFLAITVLWFILGIYVLTYLRVKCHICTYIQMVIHTHIKKYTYYTHSKYTRTHINIHRHTYTHKHTYIYQYAHINTCTYIYTHIHANTQIKIHTHKYAFTYTHTYYKYILYNCYILHMYKSRWWVMGVHYTLFSTFLLIF